MKKLILLSILLIVGCAPTKPPLATFYIGMTEEEFNEQNKDKISTYVDAKDGFITKNIRVANTQNYYDGDDPLSRNATAYYFEDDTLFAVYNGLWYVFRQKEIDYDKYATPPK